MEDKKKEESKKFKFEIRDIVIFLASGVFAKLHRKFLVPLSEPYWGDQFVNWFHQALHAAIGLAIQLVLFLWILKFIIAASKAAWGETKSHGE